MADASSHRFWKSAVERYRSPKDGMMATMRFPLFSGRLATCVAAKTEAPLEIPQKIPSWVAMLRAISMASSPAIWITSSSKLVSAFPGMKPAPMPWILWGPGFPPERTADSVGSTATIWREGFSGLRYCPQPVMVPPVPTPPTKMSTLPSVSAQISGPVVSRWIFGLSALLNCCNKNPPCVAAISSALAMAPPIPLAAGVRTSLAPKALRRTRRSMLMDSGMVRIRSYPLEAATMANPMPVLPDVGSTKTVSPGLMSPRSSAWVIMLRAMRSFTELAGLKLSSFKTISASHPSLSLESLTSGVPPIKSKTFSAILGLSAPRAVVEAVVDVDDGRVNAWAMPSEAIVARAAANFIF
ncbi:unnamed protein product [Pseudo-nitzschia multistriata]|uniref:Uncharacterized protein n=1 Tax=Pseudo-nitzschia multistriata TaxID=183589 RepID=A0A448Z883_9STRA|nr:unnamed protein product [Pseudo-nitzschia multistriata]